LNKFGQKAEKFKSLLKFGLFLSKNILLADLRDSLKLKFLFYDLLYNIWS